jgi:hypothetical protein
MAQGTIQINIAGIPVAFVLHRAVMIQALLRRYSGYLKRGRPALTLYCTFTTKRLLKKSGLSVQYSAGFFSISRRDFHCKWRGESGTLRAAPSVFAFDACLRIVYATLLPGFDGALFHAAGIVLHGGAQLFPGPSGSGKTTLSRLIRARVMNDEIIAVRKIKNGTFIASGTPFWGEMGTGPGWPSLTPLKCIYCPVKARENNVTPLEAGEAAGKLMKCLCWFVSEPEQVKLAVEVVFNLVSSVPVKILRFTRSPSFLNSVVNLDVA